MLFEVFCFFVHLLVVEELSNCFPMGRWTFVVVVLIQSEVRSFFAGWVFWYEIRGWGRLRHFLVVLSTGVLWDVVGCSGLCFLVVWRVWACCVVVGVCG